MIIKKKLGQKILCLIYLYPVISFYIKVRKETKITIKTVYQVTKIGEFPLLASMLLGPRSIKAKETQPD